MKGAPFDWEIAGSWRYRGTPPAAIAGGHAAMARPPRGRSWIRQYIDGPEGLENCMVLRRELTGLGYDGGYSS